MNYIVDGRLTLALTPDAKNRFLLIGSSHDGSSRLEGKSTISFGLRDPAQSLEFTAWLSKTEYADAEWDKDSLAGVIDLVPRGPSSSADGQSNPVPDYAVRTFKIALIRLELAQEAQDQDPLRTPQGASVRTLSQDPANGAKFNRIDWDVF